MEKTGRIIIDIREGVNEEDALQHVLAVIRWGRISVGAKGKQHYCWHTEFKDGVHVSVRAKYNTNTDTFVVYKRLKS
jgi:hypothetical protein